MSIGRLGPDFIINSTTLNAQSRPSGVSLADGRIAVAWTSNDPGDGSGTTIRLGILNADGSPARSDLVANTTTAGDQSEPALAAFSDGRLVMAWQSDDAGDGSEGAVRARIFNSDGSASASDFIVNSTSANDQFDAAIATLSGERFVVAWASEDPEDGSQGNIRARVFSTDGRAIGPDFIVNSSGAGSQDRPAIADLGGGRFVVAWTTSDGDDIRARIFNRDGRAEGSDFVVNSEGGGDHDEPVVAALSDGRFAVAWTTFDQNTSSIRARLFNADGTPLVVNDIDVGEFVVNDAVTGNVYEPAIAALPDGRYMVTWMAVTDAEDGGISSIRGKMIHPMWIGLGRDFLVNSTTENAQYSPSIVATPDGRFMATWESHDPGDGSASNIRGRLFDPTKAHGGADSEYLLGGDAHDTMSGGQGDDYLLGMGGRDRLSGDGGDDYLMGLDGDDLLFGGTGGDYLEGGAGRDAMYGGAGNDVYWVDNPGDRVIERPNQGDDTVVARISYALSANVENLRLDTSAAINGTGNALDNTITGNSGANHLRGGAGDDTLVGERGDDRLDGGAGADEMRGGLGDDVYVVDNGRDRVIETADQGTDTVRSSISWALSANVENLILTGSGNTNGAGAALANVITGNSGNNTLSGGGGNDTLRGGAGRDRLEGGAGRDRLDGGAGRDDLFGGAGADVFVFARLGDSVRGANRDRIADFARGSDKIDVSGIDANAGRAGDQAFSFIGRAGFSDKAGELRFAGGVVAGDVNGDGRADFEIGLSGITALARGDFIL